MEILKISSQSNAQNDFNLNENNEMYYILILVFGQVLKPGEIYDDLLWETKDFDKLELMEKWRGHMFYKTR